MNELLSLYMKLFERDETMRPWWGDHTLQMVGSACMWAIGDNYSDNTILIDEASALALCRCSVEDRLISKDFSGLQIERRPSGFDICCGTLVWTGPNTVPTIHYALISAANAVLDGQQSSKGETES